MNMIHTMKKLGAAALILTMSLAGAAMAENHEFVSVSVSDEQGEITMMERDGVLYDGNDNVLDPETATWPIRFSYDDEAMTCEISAPSQTMTGTYEVVSQQDEVTEMTITLEGGTVLNALREDGEEVNILTVTAGNGSDVVFVPAD